MTNPEANNEAKTRRGLSFRAKSTLIFVGLFALLIAALWLINSIYLQTLRYDLCETGIDADRCHVG